MVATFTTGKMHLEKPGNGDDVDTWNVNVNADYDLIDACVSASTGIVLSNANVTLTQGQMQVSRLSFSGTVSANIVVSLLASVPGFWIVENFTVGAFTVTLQTVSALQSVVLAQNVRYIVFSDGANVVLCDDGTAAKICAQFVPPGAIMDFAMSTTPSGWLFCDGSAISRTTYAALFTNIGTTWGVGNGSTTFTLPNFQAQFRRGWDAGGLVDPRAFASSQADSFASHNHGTNELPHTHTVPVIAGVNQAGFNNSSPFTGGGSSVTTSGSVTGLTIQSAGGSETRPKNYAVLTCIKT